MIINNTEETVPSMPIFMPLGVNTDENYHVIELQSPSVLWHYNEDIDHPHDWEGYIKIETPGEYTFSAEIDDNGYIMINDTKVVELTGTNPTRTVTGSPIELGPGYHWIKLHHENGRGPMVIAGAANAEAFVPKVNGTPITLYSIVPVVGRCPVHFELEFDTTRSVLTNQKDMETNGTTYAASGYVFEGTMQVQYSDGTHMNIPVQSGGWMAKNSPWFKPGLTGREAELYNNPSDITTISGPTSETTDTPEIWPDTCCPSTAYRMHTTFVTSPSGLVSGYVIDTQQDETSNDPNLRRGGLYFHIAKRIGSEGCISTFDYRKWNFLRGEMKRGDSSATVPTLNITFVGVTPDAQRQPENVGQ